MNAVSAVAHASLRRIAAVGRKEFLHVLRDPRSLALGILMPLIMLFLFGYALTLDVDRVRLAVWDQSASPQSRELISRFEGSRYFSLRLQAASYADLERAVDRRDALIALVIPADFADKLDDGSTPLLQVLLDGSDPSTATIAVGYAEAIVLSWSRQIVLEQLQHRQPQGVPAARLELRPRVWFNTDLVSRNFIFPGLIPVIMMIVAALLTSLSMAREWETGTMEQLISTPVRGPELVFGKAAPYFVIGMVDVAIAVYMGQWLFDVPLRGSTALVFAMAAVFLTGALFFGLTLSIVLKNQVLANQAALLGSYLPTLMLSGFVFAIENMPVPIQCLTYIVPARYFIALLRGIYLKGIGLEILWVNALLLALYGAVMVLAANRRMKLKLE